MQEDKKLPILILIDVSDRDAFSCRWQKEAQEKLRRDIRDFLSEYPRLTSPCLEKIRRMQM